MEITTHITSIITSIIATVASAIIVYLAKTFLLDGKSDLLSEYVETYNKLEILDNSIGRKQSNAERKAATEEKLAKDKGLPVEKIRSKRRLDC